MEERKKEQERKEEEEKEKEERLEALREQVCEVESLLLEALQEQI